jgi:hypothetical protein
MQKACLAQSSLEQLSAANKAEGNKDAKHKTKCDEQGVEFVPMVFESFGGCTALTSSTNDKLGNLLAGRGMIPSHSATNRLWTLFSVTLQMGNAAALAKRFPFHSDPQDF